jgi:hypothetical protein
LNQTEFLAVAFLVGFVGVGSLFLGSIFFPLQKECPSCPICPDCSSSIDFKQLQSNYNYCKQSISQQASIAKDLFEDYWQCYLAYNCFGLIEECDQTFSQGYSEANQAYAEASCSMAENYEDYFNAFGE